jgi:hypothetical protein
LFNRKKFFVLKIKNFSWFSMFFISDSTSLSEVLTKPFISYFDIVKKSEKNKKYKTKTRSNPSKIKKTLFLKEDPIDMLTLFLFLKKGLT